MKHIVVDDRKTSSYQNTKEKIVINPERVMWLLHDVSSCGRNNIHFEQYEELRYVAKYYKRKSEFLKDKAIIISWIEVICGGIAFGIAFELTKLLLEIM